MSKLVAAFDTENAAFRALQEMENHDAGTGHVLPHVGDPAEAVGTELFLSQREAARTAFGGAVGMSLAVLLIYLHHTGLITFPPLAPAFAGGTQPIYAAAALVGAALGALIAGISALAQPHEIAGPQPSVLVAYCPRSSLSDARSIVQQWGGRTI